MTERPWVKPEEVKEYSENKEVQERSDARLRVDISRAEQYVITTTHNDFKQYEELPEEVRTAVLILAEAYAHNAVIKRSGVKSESFDDYSYTAENTETDIESLDLSALLDAYVIPAARNGVTLRLRRL